MHKYMLGIVFHPIVRQQSCERFRWYLAGKLRSQSSKLGGGQFGRFSKVRDFHIVQAAQRSHLQKQIADVREGFKMMQFGGGDDRVQNGHPIARRLTADELPVLSPNGEHEPSRRLR